jgi:hypothetical protein
MAAIRFLILILRFSTMLLHRDIWNVATLALGSRPRQGVARKAGSQKEGSPGAKANALEGCGPRGRSPGVITYSRESKEVRGSVRE